MVEFRFTGLEIFLESCLIVLEFKVLLFIGIPVNYGVMLCLIRVRIYDFIDKLVFLQVINLHNLRIIALIFNLIDSI